MTTTIQLPNGRYAISFVPEDSTELAIVPLSVIQQLCKDMPRAHISEHRHQLIRQLNESNDIQQMVEVAEAFVNFHRTVTLIAEYKPAPVEPIGEVEPADLMH